MLKDIAKTYYFNQNYNCAECIIHAANDYYDLGLHDHDMRMVACQGAGFQCGEMCGALNAAGCVLSCLFVKERAHEGALITQTNGMMVKLFQEELKGLYCRDLRRMYFKQAQRCLFTVNIACDCLEKVIDKYKDQIIKD